MHSAFLALAQGSLCCLYRARRRLLQLASPPPTLLVLPQPLGRALLLSRGTDHASPASFNVALRNLHWLPLCGALKASQKSTFAPYIPLPLPDHTIPTRPRRDFSIAISLCRVTTHLHFLIRHFHEC